MGASSFPSKLGMVFKLLPNLPVEKLTKGSKDGKHNTHCFFKYMVCCGEPRKSLS